MAVVLEGDCRVSDRREGAPAPSGTLRIWPQIGPAVGAQAISLCTLQFAPGRSLGLHNLTSDEVLYVLEGDATPLTD